MKHLKVRWRSGNAAVCKTVMHGFESRSHLHDVVNSTRSLQLINRWSSHVTLTTPLVAVNYMYFKFSNENGAQDILQTFQQKSAVKYRARLSLIKE
jgi:hypothetical protein